MSEQRKYLFLDDHFLDKSEQTKRTFYQWEKEAGNPVIIKKYEWEGIGPYVFTAASKCPPYDAWYGTFGGKGDDYPAGFFHSEDGINWNGERQMSNGTDDGCQGCVGIFDEGHNFGGYPYVGTALFRRTPDVPEFHVRFRRSKDGVHWEKFPGDPYWYGPSDVLYYFWDKNINKYVAYYKLWKVEGKTLDGKHFLAYFPGFEPTIDGNTFRVQGVSVLPERKDIDVTLEYGGGTGDDGGGGSIDEKVTMIRIVARAESSDFIHWEKEQVIIEPPEGAPLGDQSYGMYIQPYAGIYVGSYQFFSSVSGNIYSQLAWSFDGVHYSVYNEKPVLSCGESGSWDAGMVIPANFYENMDGRMCTYYGAINADHKAADDIGHNVVNGAIGRAWMRIDGFASLQGGNVTTLPLKVTGEQISFNMKGVIGLALRDENGAVIVVQELRGDHYKLIANVNLSAYVGKKVRVELDLSEGELFSLSI